MIRGRDFAQQIDGVPRLGAARVRPIENYPDLLLSTLKSMASDWRASP